MPENTPISELVSRCIEGDSKAQRQLFQKYKEVFLGLTYRTLGPSFEPDEVVQKIFIQVFKSLKSFKGKSTFDTWVYRIGLNVCTSELRRRLRKRQIQIVPDADKETLEARDLSPGPLKNLEQEELAAKIYESLDRIDIKKRVVIVMYDIEEKSLNEISKILGKPVGTIKSRLFHGREELKRYLNRYVKF